MLACDAAPLHAVNEGAGTDSVYSIDATSGALSPIAGSPFVAVSQPSAVAICD